jgi:hypothetical protein
MLSRMSLTQKDKFSRIFSYVVLANVFESRFEFWKMKGEDRLFREQKETIKRKYWD